MQGLQTLIDQLERNRNIHISILDLSGMLSTPLTKINVKSVIHSKKFCDIAKSTERGYRACLYSKRLANEKAISGGEAFCGQCIYGLCEAAMPVITERGVCAIVYVGNAIIDICETKLRISKTCALTGVAHELLYSELENSEKIENESELYEIAEIVSDYLKMLYRNAPIQKSGIHWLALSMKQYADECFCYNISLKELSITYSKNEKYIGRLFKQEIGVTFSEYCMTLRLEKARRMLCDSTEKIIDVALECGFNNVSYFNRAFRNRYGASPKEYRVKNAR